MRLVLPLWSIVDLRVMAMTPHFRTRVYCQMQFCVRPRTPFSVMGGVLTLFSGYSQYILTSSTS